MTDHLEKALQERLLARSQVSPRDVDALRVFARTLPARRSFWQRPALQGALAGAAVVLAAVVALQGLFSSNQPRGGAPSPSPTYPAIGPAPAPSPTPGAPAPIETPHTADGAVIPLSVASGSDVNVVIDDHWGLLLGATALQAPPTMSVRWFESIVETFPSEAPGTGAIKLTWVGFPRDEIVYLTLNPGDGASASLIVEILQAGPPPNSDGLGEDRVLVLSFPEPVDPDKVLVTFDTR